LSRLDHVLSGIERALGTVFDPEPLAGRASPAGALADGDLDDDDRRHAAGLMRVNHVGEVCAQALYSGHALTARDAAVAVQMQAAAAEETDHLAWCAERLAELGSRPSLLNPLWYAGAWLMGVASGLAGDPVSLGFVVETERQVEAHLGTHLEALPAADQRSRAIVARMQSDEAEHAARACAAGAVPLPAPLPGLMRVAAGVMKRVAYRL
jgi:ubiquinone biosynthesis monooxygenase Coq7